MILLNSYARKKKRFFTAFMNMLLINEEEVLKERIPRTCRRFIRNSGWFENVSQYSNERFKNVLN